MAAVDEIAQWQAELDRLVARMSGLFGSRVGLARMGLYVRGLLGPAERKNGWQLAEEAGEATPYAMQQFLFRGGWSADDVGREMRRYVVEALGEAQGVLVIDETGVLKKGTHSVGVQRQYSGTAGRVENCQIAVLLGYATSKGRALLDRALYLPKSWTDDPARCAKAGVPETVTFQTKPALGRTMVERALDEGVPASWVAGDCVYGDDPELRRRLEARRIGYVMATSHNDAAVAISLRTRPLREVIAALAEGDWQRLSAGEGSQGPRLYDWQLVMLSTFPNAAWRRGLLVQRSVHDPSEIKVHRCFFPVGTSLSTLVHVAGCRWTIETDIEEAKGEVGLDHYEVRSWDGWHRHISLALLAHAFLAVTKATSDAAAVAAIKGGPTHHPRRPMVAFKASRGLSCP